MIAKFPNKYPKENAKIIKKTFASISLSFLKKLLKLIPDIAYTLNKTDIIYKKRGA